MNEPRTEDTFKKTRTRAALWMIAALLSGLFATMLVARVIGEGRTAPETVPTRAVVVAAADIAPGQTVAIEDVKTVDWPAAFLPEGAFQNAQEVAGKAAGDTILQSEPITVRRLAQSGQEGGELSLTIPDDMRAMSVAVNEIVGVAGFLRPKDLVDVIAVMPPNPGVAQGEPHSRIILQGIRVLAIGDQTRRLVGVGTPNAPKGTLPKDMTVATLLVTPAQSESLALAADQGRVWLSLRSPLDLQSVSTGGVDHSTLVGLPPEPVPPLPPAPQPPRRGITRKPKPPDLVDVVEVFRGKSLEERKIRKAESP